MKRITVLGAGPAAVVSALLLQQMNFAVQVLGRRRRDSLLEGASSRVAEGLRRAGCKYALEVMGPIWERASSWGGEYQIANGEHVIERSLFDSALIDDLEEAGIDFHDLTVMGIDRIDDEVRIYTRQPDNRPLTFFADYLIDARGKSTPKVAKNILAGPLSVALSRHYSGGKCGTRRTISESFEDGWAWGTADVDGKCSIQFVVDPSVLEKSGELNTRHDYFYTKLQAIPRELGDVRACSETIARGAQAVLRGNLINPFSLRVGDAAYSNDPLSGHGMYEAISSAFAAAPVINTILNEPAQGLLAMHYYEDRAALTFAQRAKAGVSYYQNELRWAERGFWATRSTWDQWKPILASKCSGGLLTVAPVVEDGLIKLRSVVITDQHPQGVRFLGGIDLTELISHLCEHGASDAMQTAESRLKADSHQISAAIHWLSNLPELSAPSFDNFIARLRMVTIATAN
ncbi:NAD(P)/FAD-dependent oxidoreductase [Pseudomonas sp. Marseille-Q5117]|uniref:flavin-dependent monooxygenase QhpG n=1 Tax=Pseudomonas sp. Marseille-Q5117 TaxID=2972777 RepID=UPI0021C924E6|nr:hypothetical protein [Pseudomonas sp. Marseille-Q5117]